MKENELDERENKEDIRLVFNEEFNEDGPPNKDRWKYDLGQLYG